MTFPSPLERWGGALVGWDGPGIADEISEETMLRNYEVTAEQLLQAQAAQGRLSAQGEQMLKAQNASGLQQTSAMQSLGGRCAHAKSRPIASGTRQCDDCGAHFGERHFSLAVPNTPSEYKLGALHPLQCNHVRLRLDGPFETLSCDDCLVRIPAQAIKALGTPRYDEQRMKLADECGRLQEEKRGLLTENAMLRRKLEALERGRRGR